MSQNLWRFLVGLVEVVGTSLINAIAQLSDIIGGLAQALSGLIDFVTGVFTGDWDKAWNGIKKSIFRYYQISLGRAWN